MPYDINGKGYDPNEHEYNGVMRAVAVAIAAVIAIVIIGYGLESCGAEEEPAYIAEQSLFTINTNNSAQMHRYGMPTKTDVMQWHMNGQWGYWSGGTLNAFDELPGNSRDWDAFYGIDSDNRAFDK